MDSNIPGEIKVPKIPLREPVRLVKAERDGAELSYVWTRNEYGGHKLFCVGRRSFGQKNPMVYPIVVDDSSKFYCDCKFLDDFEIMENRHRWSKNEIDLSTPYGKMLAESAMEKIEDYAAGFTDFWGETQCGTQVHEWTLANTGRGGLPMLFAVWSDSANAYAGEFEAKITANARGKETDVVLSLTKLKLTYCWEEPCKNFKYEIDKAMDLYGNSMRASATFTRPNWQWVKNHRLWDKLSTGLEKNKKIVQMRDDVFFTGAFSPVPGCYYDTMPLHLFGRDGGLKEVPFEEGVFIWDDFGTCHLLT